MGVYLVLLLKERGDVGDILQLMLRKKIKLEPLRVLCDVVPHFGWPSL